MGPVYRFLLLLLPDGFNTCQFVEGLSFGFGNFGLGKRFWYQKQKKQSGKKMTKTKAKTKRLLFVVDNDIDP